MERQIIGREEAVECLASICDGYRQAAKRSLKSGGNCVYVALDSFSDNSLLALLSNPPTRPERVSVSQRGVVYPSYTDFLTGRSRDGEEHKRCLVVDVIAKMVLDMMDREGKSLVPPQYATSPKDIVRDFMGRPPSYCL
jgi:hypothetical protein